MIPEGKTIVETITMDEAAGVVIFYVVDVEGKVSGGCHVSGGVRRGGEGRGGEPGGLCYNSVHLGHEGQSPLRRHVCQ